MGKSSGTKITWEEARIYARAVGGDLPTEEEWEKACRGKSDARIYPWGDSLDLFDDYKVIYGGSRLDEPISVDDEKYQNDKSPYGVLGMASNVHEYTLSKFNANGTEIVLRGGYFKSGKEDMRCAKRSHTSTENRNPDYGFRVVWHSESGK